MNLGMPYWTSPRWCVLLAIGAATTVSGCTFMPRGARTLQRQAVLEGRPFLKSPQERHLPPLSSVPAPRELVRRALLNSPDVEAAYWRWRAAIEAIAQRGTEMTVPALGASVGLKNGTASNDSTMLQLANMSSAPIEWPSKPLAEARAALQRAYAAGWQYRRAQFAVRRQTLDAWYRLVADSAMLDLLRRDAVLLRELDAFARARIEAGAVSPTAALTIENGLTGLRARITAVSAELPADRAALNRLIGRPVSQPLRVPGTLPHMPIPQDSLTRLLTLVVRRNPDLAALRRDIRAGRIDIERAKMNYIPDFSLSAATSLDGITQNLGGGIMFPIVRYQAINAAIRQNRDWLRESEAQLRSARLSVAAQIVADLVMVQSDARQTGLYEGVLLPRLQRLAVFARTDVEQSRAAIDEPIQIERTRVEIQETILELRLNENEHLADIDALLATRLENAN